MNNSSNREEKNNSRVSKIKDVEEQRINNKLVDFRNDFPIFKYWSNSKCFRLLSGFITFYIGLIFVNPIVTINKQLRMYPNYWKSYIPSFEFIIIIVAAIGMIFCAFVIHEKDYKIKEKMD